MSTFDRLYIEGGQSAWVDNIRRDWLNDGTLQGLVDRGVRGVTSNPSIFAKAVASTPAYDDFIRAASGSDEEVFEALAVADVREACTILTPIYEASVREREAGLRRYTDGYVSLEVSPRLAHDTEATVAAALALSDALRHSPNLMIKIPATKAGLPAITRVLGHGINVNVTLIFSISRYREVMDAYLAGVALARANGHDVRLLASVASFFVSRVDAAIDAQIDDPALRGQAAVAQVAGAYEAYLDRFSQADARELLAVGAQTQRPLWASTSTKNPTYDALLYVDNLVAPETVNTLPDATLAAYGERGRVDASVLTSPEKRRVAQGVLAQLAALGIDLDAVTDQLEDDGVEAFMTSYDELLATVKTKRENL